jgi:hypothetical protein
MYVWMDGWMYVCIYLSILQGSGRLRTMSDKAYITYASEINVIQE